ncbi:MAG: hypothetical protein AMXMBFR47_08420 [Planctomycetota bacterium]
MLREGFWRRGVVLSKKPMRSQSVRRPPLDSDVTRCQWPQIDARNYAYFAGFAQLLDGKRQPQALDEIAQCAAVQNDPYASHAIMVPMSQSEQIIPGIARERGVRMPVFFLGIVAVAVCITTSGLMAADYFDLSRLPGCGPGSACAEAAASMWGRIPGLGLPVSLAGLAFFLAIAAGWLQSRGGISPGMRALVRVGGLVSFCYAIIMIATGMHCIYCLITHAANFVFWILVERIGVRLDVPARAPRAFLGVFVVAIAGLGVADYLHRGALERRAIASADESTRAIIEATSQRADAAAQPGIDQAPATRVAPTGTAAETAQPGGKPFTGRWRLGPEKAAIRIVVASDFQCPACRLVDAEIMEILKNRPDVSVSMKHFPMNTTCNPHAGTTMHPNACYAAWAAEAAGLLGGNEAFWKIHDTLFARAGRFESKADLKAIVEPLGYDVNVFEKIMKSPDAAARVKEDIDDCMAVGMRYTPMVMINGVEFRGWERQGAIREAVEKLAATNPPPLGPEADIPPPAIERFASQWREGAEVAIDTSTAPTMGAADAPIHVVVFGDYEEPISARVDTFLRDRVAADPRVRYSFMHYPANTECNPTLPQTIHARACWAAKIAEAVRIKSGDDAFWRVHAWLMANQKSLTESALLAAAHDLAIDGPVTVADATRGVAGARITQQSQIGKSLGLTAIPWIYVNGKRVEIWETQGQNVLARVLDRLAEDAP